jgi:hypothetical protein
METRTLPCLDALPKSSVGTSGLLRRHNGPYVQRRNPEHCGRASGNPS